MLMGGMGGGMGDPNNPMASMLPLLLLGGDDSIKSDAEIDAICTKTGISVAQAADCTTKATAYKVASALCTAAPTDACKSQLNLDEAAIRASVGDSSSNNDLLMMMMLGGMGGAGGAGGMNSMLPLLLLGDGLGSSGSSNDMLLPLMLMGGMGGGMGDPNNPMASMLPLLLLGGDDSIKSDAEIDAICTKTGISVAQAADCTTKATAYKVASALCTAAPTDACKSQLNLDEAA